MISHQDSGMRQSHPYCAVIASKHYVSFFYVHVQLATVRFNYLLITVVKA